MPESLPAAQLELDPGRKEDAVPPRPHGDETGVIENLLDPQMMMVVATQEVLKENKTYKSLKITNLHTLQKTIHIYMRVCPDVSGYLKIYSFHIE